MRGDARIPHSAQDKQRTQEPLGEQNPSFLWTRLHLKPAEVIFFFKFDYVWYLISI